MNDRPHRPVTSDVATGSAALSIHYAPCHDGIGPRGHHGPARRQYDAPTRSATNYSSLSRPSRPLELGETTARRQRAREVLAIGARPARHARARTPPTLFAVVVRRKQAARRETRPIVERDPAGPRPNRRQRRAATSRSPATGSGLVAMCGAGNGSKPAKTTRKWNKKAEELSQGLRKKDEMAATTQLAGRAQRRGRFQMDGDPTKGVPRDCPFIDHRFTGAKKRERGRRKGRSFRYLCNPSLDRSP
jgi:hypothetical protein